MPRTLALLAGLFLSFALAFSLAGAGAAAPAGKPITVAAASDLKFALDELVDAYQRSTGRTVRVVYGSSGNFARQIEQGAPFDVFLSADESFVEALARKGLTVDDGVLYAIGRLVLHSPAPEIFRPDEALEGLREAIAAGRIRRFAIANPEHAPYGRAAREALQSAGLWPALVDRLVLGENVSQAAQFAIGGNAQGGIFALSLVHAPGVAGRGSHVVLPEALHAPLRQRMVVLRRAPPEAAAFRDFVRQPAARAVFERYGFTLPKD
jgi:molybdate transport system substrate-binding protein